MNSDGHARPEDQRLVTEEGHLGPGLHHTGHGPALLHPPPEGVAHGRQHSKAQVSKLSPAQLGA